MAEPQQGTATYDINFRPSAPGASQNSVRRIGEFASLRSTFKDQDNFLRQGDDSGNRSYFPGGNRSLENVCYFKSSGLNMNPEQITLYLSPNNVTWDYTLKTNVIDTYGGQVVQILGVSIENMTIEGFFGSEGMWGWNVNNEGHLTSSRFEQESAKDYLNDPMKSGLYQLSEWFKEYFYKVTQYGNFQTENLVFHYPHMDWEWNIRPLDFPRVRFANDELLPQWQLKCDFIEDKQGTFTQEVTNSAKVALTKLEGKVGFSRFIEWSEPMYKSAEDRTKVASDVGVKYSEFVGKEFTDDEVKILAAGGFSFPSKNLDPYVEDAVRTASAIVRRLKPVDPDILKKAVEDQE